MTELLEAYGRVADGTESMAELLARLAEDDPRLALVARMMAAQQTAEPEADPEPDETDVEVADLLRRLHDEVSELRARNDALAAALGACHLCWGDEADCPRCRGRGQPGAVRPDRLAFTTWVLPAARRVLRARRTDLTPAPEGERP